MLAVDIPRDGGPKIRRLFGRRLGMGRGPRGPGARAKDPATRHQTVPPCKKGTPAKATGGIGLRAFHMYAISERTDSGAKAAAAADAEAAPLTADHPNGRHSRRRAMAVVVAGSLVQATANPSAVTAQPGTCGRWFEKLGRRHCVLPTGSHVRFAYLIRLVFGHADRDPECVGWAVHRTPVGERATWP